MYTRTQDKGRVLIPFACTFDIHMNARHCSLAYLFIPPSFSLSLYFCLSVYETIRKSFLSIFSSRTSQKNGPDTNVSYTRLLSYTFWYLFLDLTDCQKASLFPPLQRYKRLLSTFLPIFTFIFFSLRSIRY